MCRRSFARCARRTRQLGFPRTAFVVCACVATRTLSFISADYQNNWKRVDYSANQLRTNKIQNRIVFVLLSSHRVLSSCVRVDCSSPFFYSIRGGSETWLLPISYCSLPIREKALIENAREGNYVFVSTKIIHLFCHDELERERQRIQIYCEQDDRSITSFFFFLSGIIRTMTSSSLLSPSSAPSSSSTSSRSS